MASMLLPFDPQAQDRMDQHQRLLLQRQYDLFMCALRSVVASSDYLSKEGMYHLSVTNKDVCAIIKQAVHSLDGDSDVLGVIGNGCFPSVRELSVSLSLIRSRLYEKGWRVPSPVVSSHENPYPLESLRSKGLDLEDGLSH